MNHPRKREFTSGPFSIFHKPLHEKLEKARVMFETSPFNRYLGPEKPELLIITCGACTSYCIEAVEELKLNGEIGILKLGTTWPLPEKLVARHLILARKILFIEEMDPFVEQSVMELAASLLPATANLSFFGARSGHITPYNELSTDIVIDALSDILNVPYRRRESAYENLSREAAKLVPHRPIQPVPGLPPPGDFLGGKTGHYTGRPQRFSLR